MFQQVKTIFNGSLDSSAHIRKSFFANVDVSKKRKRIFCEKVVSCGSYLATQSTIADLSVDAQANINLRRLQELSGLCTYFNTGYIQITACLESIIQDWFFVHDGDL